MISKSINILETNINISETIKNNWKDSWGKNSEDIGLFNNAKNSGIRVFIFNKETVQGVDL